MIAGLLLLAFILWLSLTFEHEVEKPNCKQGHSWIYDETDHLICSVCKRRPGDE